MTDQQAVLEHQAFTAMPRLQQPIVNPDGTISVPWYRWLTNLWARAGQGMQQISSAVFLQQTTVNAGAPISAYSSITGELIGQIQLTSSVGGPAEPQTLVSSPFAFTASETGSLVVFGGKLGWSRDDGVTFYPVSLVGGAIRLLLGDIARVEWSGAEPPSVVWFPDFLEAEG